MSYQAFWEKDQNKLNNVELIKLKKDGLDVIKTIIDKYSIEGYDSVSEEDRVLLKWGGIYDQKPRAGHFMMRVRINSCIMNTKQARAIAEVALKYGRDIVKITTRGAIQFYWITLDQLPEVFKTFEAVGLSTFEACGDCPRTIVGNPLAGIDNNELLDTTGIVRELNEFFLLNRDFSNLPRKFKMSVSSSSVNPAHREINDLSFTPAVKVINGEEIKGFHVWVGGGLSVKPHLAKQLDLFVLPEEVLKVAIGVATIFRDHGYRESRQHARLKFLVDDWGAEKFKEELLKLTGPLRDQGEERVSGWNGAYFYGIHPQKQEGKSYLGLQIPMGHMDSGSLLELADLADRYGDGKLRTTMSQNMILSGVDTSFVPELVKDPVIIKYPAETTSYIKNMIACTGSEYCNLAIVETRNRARDIAQYLDEHMIGEIPIRINLVGCPNNCGHALIADIGLRGCLAKTESGMAEAFDIMIGGNLGPEAGFSQKLNGRIPAERINKLILEYILYYKNKRNHDEDFHQFVNRMGLSSFQEILDKYI